MLTILQQRDVHFGRIVRSVPHFEYVADLNVLDRHEIDVIVLLVGNQILFVAEVGRRHVDHPVAFVRRRRVQIDVAHFEQFAELGNVQVIGDARVAENDERKAKAFDGHVGFFGQQRSEARAFGELLRCDDAGWLMGIDDVQAVGHGGAREIRMGGRIVHDLGCVEELEDGKGNKKRDILLSEIYLGITFFLK